MNKEGFIRDITRKLCGNVQLDWHEIHTIISTLRESNQCFQEPYYEVIYHDKYDNTETRIMNPVTSKISQMPSGEFIQEDRFDLSFRRIIPWEDVDRDRWVPVTERLPEENKTVIASTEYGVYPEVRYTKENGWEWAYESGADYWEKLAGVMAWMALPRPYKPLESE